MSLSSHFNHDLSNYLNCRFEGLGWKAEFPLSRSTRERVDVGGEAKGKSGKHAGAALIEIELRREDPVSNIIKVWQEVLANRRWARSILIQGFSRVYRSPKHHSRRIRAMRAQKIGKFLAKHSSGKFEYVPLKIDYYPLAGSNEGDGARYNTAHRFGEQVISLLNRRKLR